MVPVKRAFTNIICDDVEAVTRFYEQLLGLSRTGDFGWFVLLGYDEKPDFALGVLAADHETVPESLAVDQGGMVLTFVVDDVHRIHERALAMQADILEPPKALSYGQTRLLLRDPAGCAVDISSPTP